MELARRVGSATGPWIVESVRRIVDAWGALGDGPERDIFFERVEALSRDVAAEVEAALTAFADSDVDAQATTPVSVLRVAVSAPTALLREIGVPPLRRDRFSEARFPEDIYGLMPSSLKEVDPSLGEVAVVWGAAKAMAHRRRHERR